MSQADSAAALRVFYVGSVVPDRPRFWSEAFNRSGNIFQTEFVKALADAGTPPEIVLAFLSIQSVPRSKRLWVSGEKVEGPGGIPTTLMGFLNVTPLKEIQLGVSAMFRMASARWKHGGGKGGVVVVCFNLSVPPGAFILAGARLIGAKAVAQVNDIAEPGETVPRGLLRRLDYWLHRQLIPRFDALIVVSDETVTDFGRPGQPWLRVEGAAPSNVLRSTGPEYRKRPQEDGRFVAVLAGSLEQYNGVELVLGAFRRLKGEGFRLVVAGAGRLKDRVIEAADGDSRISYAGLLDHEGVLELYRDADVLLNVRLTKAVRTRYFFPLKLLEYLGTGVPVISTCVGRIPETFGDAVTFVEEESSVAVAAALERLERTPVRDRLAMAARARRIVEERFTWPAQGRRAAEFLRLVAEGRGGKEAARPECASD